MTDVYKILHIHPTTTCSRDKICLNNNNNIKNKSFNTICSFTIKIWKRYSKIYVL